MYSNKKEITINVVIEYEYNSEEEVIKEIIKQIVDVKGVKKLEIEEKK